MNAFFMFPSYSKTCINTAGSSRCRHRWNSSVSKDSPIVFGMADVTKQGLEFQNQLGVFAGILRFI